MVSRIWKPWFVYRPWQLVRRAAAGMRPVHRGIQPLRTSWGLEISADPSRNVGRSIATTGVFDLAVSEALFRLIIPGDTVVDAGANIGYMTVLASLAAAPAGRVLAFEPHPELFAVLQHNASRARATLDVAVIEVHQAALGETPGPAQLRVPAAFADNDGLASIRADMVPDGSSVTVQVVRLDDVLGETSVGVVKLDVEGFEPEVLRGSRRALTSKRIRHVVFEDHSVGKSEAVRLLQAHGYEVFSLGWSMRRLTLRPVAGGALATPYEAPSFIATLAPEEVRDRLHAPGWSTLSDRIARGLVVRRPARTASVPAQTSSSRRPPSHR